MRASSRQGRHAQFAQRIRIASNFRVLDEWQPVVLTLRLPIKMPGVKRVGASLRVIRGRLVFA
jgi:hypothetical protein